MFDKTLPFSRNSKWLVWRAVTCLVRVSERELLLSEADLGLLQHPGWSAL